MLIVVGPGVVAIGMIGSGLASGLLSLILWRFVAGLGSSMYMTGSLAYVVDIATPHNRTRMLAVNQAALLLGVAIGPWLGGFVGARFGLRSPFFVVAAAAVAASIYAYLRMPETLPKDRAHSDDQLTRARTQRNMRSLLTAPFIAIAFVSFAQFLTRGTSPQALIPLAGAETFSMDVDTIGLLLGAMAMMSLLLLPAGRERRRASCRCWTSCASFENRAARKVCAIASRKMPVTTALKGLASIRALRVASRPPSAGG